MGAGAPFPLDKFWRFSSKLTSAMSPGVAFEYDFGTGWQGEIGPWRPCFLRQLMGILVGTNGFDRPRGPA